MNHALILLTLGLLIGTIHFRNTEAPNNPKSPVKWPETFEGQPLQALPLSKRETTFTQNFPGAIATFTCPNGRQVIFRQVNCATRKLHNTSTCLRASGHHIGERTVQSGWTQYTASLNGDTWQVSERIQSVSGNAKWAENSAWYWHALLHPNNGPWLAVTILDQ